MNRYQELRNLVDSFQKDFEKFYEKNNKTAGVRLRKHMQDLRKYAQTVREEVQSIKGSMNS